MLLRALDANATGDLQGEVDAFLDDAQGFPAHQLMVAALQCRATDVIAIGSGYELTTGNCNQIAADRHGEFTMLVLPDHPGVVCLDGSGAPLFFERAPAVVGLPLADRWKLLKESPAKTTLTFDEKASRTCDRSDCTEVVAACGHKQVEEELGVVGELPWGMTADEQATKRKHELVELVEEFNGFGCTACGFAEPKPEGWAPWDGVPSIAGCPGVKAVEPPKLSKVAELNRRAREDRGAKIVNEIPKASKAAAITIANEIDGRVPCEDCGERIKPNQTIVDSVGNRRCGTCHKRHAMGMNDPAQFCQEHPTEGGGRFRIADCPQCYIANTVPFDGPGPAPEVGKHPWEHGERHPEHCSHYFAKDDAVACTESCPCPDGCPCRDARHHVGCDHYHVGPLPGGDVCPCPPSCGCHPCPGPAVEETGLPPEHPCGNCGHVGKHHDFKTRKCAACALCDNYVARVELPDVDPNKVDIPDRWKVECPACPAAKTTGEDPTGKPCADCGCKTTLVKRCGAAGRVEFDWARFLVRQGVLGIAGDIFRCLVGGCRGEKDQRIWFHPDNVGSVAHEGCVQEELGYAAVMLREGDLVTAELNEAAAENGEAKKEPCAVCGDEIEPGVTCYANGPEGQQCFAHYACVEGKGTEPPVAAGDSRDICEWNPEEGRTVSQGDPFHSLAEVIVGTGKKARRLCKSCRKMKPHTRLRKEVPIAAKAERSSAPEGATA